MAGEALDDLLIDRSVEKAGDRDADDGKNAIVEEIRCMDWIASRTRPNLAPRAISEKSRFLPSSPAGVAAILKPKRLRGAAGAFCWSISGRRMLLARIC